MFTGGGFYPPPWAPSGNTEEKKERVMKIRNGPNERNEAQYEGNVAGEGIAIALSENDPSANTQWVLLVFVQTPQGEYFLGGLTTNTAATDGAPARIVAFASCPGAIGWKVRALNNFPTSNTEYDAELWVIPGKCCGGSANIPGVTPPPQPPGSGGEGGEGGFTPPSPPS